MLYIVHSNRNIFNYLLPSFSCYVTTAIAFPYVGLVSKIWKVQRNNKYIIYYSIHYKIIFGNPHFLKNSSKYFCSNWGKRRMCWWAKSEEVRISGCNRSLQPFSLDMMKLFPVKTMFLYILLLDKYHTTAAVAIGNNFK